MPPSVNALFRQAAFKGGKGRTVTPEYAAWKEDAGYALKKQFKGGPLAPPYGVVIELNLNHKSDIDNRIKPILDLLVAHGVITGDQWVDHLFVMRGHTVKGCSVNVRTLQPDLI